jgi:LDH2 family malate/lactate/ureidoglycolate dehydrogenase
VSGEEARVFARRILGAADASDEDAALVAESLVLAEQAGHGGHGLARLPGYAGRLSAGGTVSGPWRLLHARGPLETYDGRAGLGHVHIWRAADRAAELAGEHGAAIVGVRRSNHCGALGVQSAGSPSAASCRCWPPTRPPSWRPPALSRPA